MTGPGTQPVSYIYRDDKWGVRAMSARGRMFLYVDEPVGEDDGSLEDVLPWGEMAEKYDPLFLLGDYSGVPKSWVGKKVFKDSCPRSNPDAIAFFHPVVIDKEAKSIEECQYLSGFQGAISTHSCRQKLEEAVSKLSPAYFFPKDLFWSCDAEDQTEMRREYIDLLEDTKFPLCPRGKGLNSIRFFEALRLGRIPVLAADETKLPLEWMIDYDEFVVRVPEKELGLANEYIERWRHGHRDIKEASAKAQETSLIYFSNPETLIHFCLKEVHNGKTK